MRVVAQNLSPELTLVEKVRCESHICCYFLCGPLLYGFNSSVVLEG